MKEERRTRSELVCEALQTYISIRQFLTKVLRPSSSGQDAVVSLQIGGEIT